MNLKLFLLITFAIALPFYASAQNSSTSFSLSEEFKEKVGWSQLHFAEDDGEGGVFIIRKRQIDVFLKNKPYILEHYGTDMAIFRKKELNIEDGIIRGMLVNDGQLTIIHCIENEDKSGYDYYLLQSDLEELNFTREKILSVNTSDYKKKHRIFTTLEMLDHNPAGEIVFSENKEYILFNFYIRSKSEDRHKFILYDKNFNTVIEKTLGDQFAEEYFQYYSIDIDESDGSVYFMGFGFENQKIKLKYKRNVNAYPKLYKFASSGSSSYTIDAEKYFFHGLDMRFEGNKIQLCGIFQDKYLGGGDGVASFTMQKDTLKLEKSNFSPFRESHLLYGKYKKMETNKEERVDLTSTILKDVHYDKLGQKYLVFEEVVEVLIYGVSTYHYYDIIVVKIDEKGEVLWVQRIYKKQMESQDFLSFVSALEENALKLYFNVSKVGSNYRDDLVFTSLIKSSLKFCLVEINESGGFYHRVMLKNSNSSVKFKPKYAVKTTSSNSIIIEGERRKRKQILRIR